MTATLSKGEGEDADTADTADTADADNTVDAPLSDMMDLFECRLDVFCWQWKAFTPGTPERVVRRKIQMKRDVAKCDASTSSSGRELYALVALLLHLHVLVGII
eukprot:983562_1